MSEVAVGGGGGPTLLRPTGDREGDAPGAGMLGMTLFLASLSMLFAASLVAYFVVRLRAVEWRPEGAELPGGLWLSTALLALLSALVQKALWDIRAGRERALRAGLAAACGVAAGFLACQGWNWLRFDDARLLYDGSLFGFTFYMLTGLHGLHVLGGLVSLIVVTVLAWRGAYSWAYYPGVRYNVVYWHYLGVVWVVLLAVLHLGG